MPDAYRSMLDTNRRRIADVVGQLADAPLGPLAVHCSAGRDRTGVLVALALSITGVTPTAIAADYALTEGCSKHRGGASDTRFRRPKSRLPA